MPSLTRPLPAPTPTAIVELDVLQRFWANPAAGFLRQRLELSGDWDEALPDESIPLGLDQLQSWALRDRALAGRLRDLDPESVIVRIRAGEPGGISERLDRPRRPGRCGGGSRYVVIDHKSNRLGSPNVPLTAWHYRREPLDGAVRQAQYPLQAMLYSVALHRFLRWRLPDYDPVRYLGGVA